MFISIELNGAEIKFNVFQFQRKKTILYNNYSLLCLKYDTFVYFRQIKMLTKMKEGEKSERETEEGGREAERQRGGARDVEVQWISSQRCGRKRKEGHHFRRFTREYIYIYFKEEHKRCNLNEMSDESVNGRRRHCGGGIHDDVCPEYV